MLLREMLEERGIQYQWSHHDPAFTAQDLAHRLHTTGHAVVKPVLVQADGRFVICAVPASRKVDVSLVKDFLDARDVHLASEAQLKQVCKDCELGAEPPIGTLFHVSTILDEHLADQRTLTFQAGTHRDAVTMSLGDFVRLADPMVADITG